MPGVIEVIIIMAIYKEIKKRMNADGSKALVASAFPGELQSQIVSDFRVAVSEYVAQQRTRSEAKAAAVARAKAAKPTLRSRASWFFKASSVDLVDKKEEKDVEQVENKIKNTILNRQQHSILRQDDPVLQLRHRLRLLSLFLSINLNLKLSLRWLQRRPCFRD
ncbi:hypothetical protein BCR33DRAFT_468930 [Rhizoclosmatium globosum]|uniref:Uncharacterized protein n=1 Tax=Rhizoclosmatium globosum TaxID=329046 RepID=A0A1Y2BQN1_9FUNG|nr:hypothetical protein BCR33DRAFT_468930 [Rhizoclosmatium globosum]|eukprot:ORY37043.1 hypothetical protein BCR33DRAFT_468930 [Rhizoclosmatium globosum]